MSAAVNITFLYVDLVASKEIGRLLLTGYEQKMSQLPFARIRDVRRELEEGKRLVELGVLPADYASVPAGKIQVEDGLFLLSEVLQDFVKIGT